MHSWNSSSRSCYQFACNGDASRTAKLRIESSKEGGDAWNCRNVTRDWEMIAGKAGWGAGARAQGDEHQLRAWKFFLLLPRLLFWRSAARGRSARHSSLAGWICAGLGKSSNSMHKPTRRPVRRSPCVPRANATRRPAQPGHAI